VHFRPDEIDKKLDTLRNHALWGSLLAGVAGVEWYFGYRYPHTDLTLEDFRSRELWWKQSAIDTSFLSNYPLEEMEVPEEILDKKKGYCLSK
jgi:hypothetical protein